MTHGRWIAAVWLVVVAGILGPSIVGSKVFLGTDLLERFAPWASVEPDNVEISNPLVGDTVDGPTKVLFRERLRGGEIAPLWNAYALGGRPLASVPNQALYSPINAPNWVLPPWYAPVVSKIIELITATGLMFLFLRRLSLGRASALIAGLIYAFSGFQVVWTNWSQAHIGALIPGVFWAVEYAIQKRTLRSAVPLVLVTTVMWLEGFPAVTIFALIFAGIYALVRISDVADWRERTKGLALSLMGIVGGLALAAFQLIPFAYSLSELNVSSRVQEPNWYLARRTLATLGVPNAFGSPVDQYYGPADYLVYGPVNYVEIQAFIGIMALVLIALSAVYGLRVVRRTTFWYLWVSAGFIAALMYAAGPVLNLYHALPLIGSNYVGRLRSVLLFLLAALAGIGFETLVRRLPESASSRHHAGFVAALGVELVVIGWALQRAGEMAAEAGLNDYFNRQVAIAAIVAILVLGLIAAIHLGGRRVSRLALGAIPVVVAVEIVMFALPYWPQVPREQYYPITATHTYLEANLGGERIASGDVTLYPSTTTFYKIRTVVGHSFTPPQWGEALVAIDRDAFRFSATFTTLRSTPEIALSPVLDRMAAMYFAVPPEVTLFGSRWTTSVIAPASLDPGASLDIPLDGRRAAGVELQLPVGHDPGEIPDTISTEIIAASGTTIASGFRRITRAVPAGVFQVGVPSVEGAQIVRVTNNGDTPIALAQEPVTIVIPEKNLPVAFSGGAVLYERETALPRIRWASSSLTIPDPAERVAALAQGVAEDTVILSSQPESETGGEATLEILEDAGADRIAIAVSAGGPGFLVVADSMQSGWVATLNGEPVDIVPADHFGVAIAIPKGDHVVVFDVEPVGWSLGLRISFLTGAGLAAMTVVGGIRRKSQSSRR